MTTNFRGFYVNVIDFTKIPVYVLLSTRLKSARVEEYQNRLTVVLSLNHKISGIFCASLTIFAHLAKGERTGRIQIVFHRVYADSSSRANK